MLNVLVAYPYMKKELVAALKGFNDAFPGHLRFILDSGAFTAFNSGKPIELDDYCRFIESLPIEPWNYFSLDVIGDEERTVKNYDTMLERGFNPVPVFTLGADSSVIEHYYSRTDYIAFGGLVGRPRNKILSEISNFYKIVGDRKAHLLGYTSNQGVKYFKPYSCDSSSWEGGARFGGADVYIGNGKMLRMGKNEFIRRPSEKVIQSCQRLGIDPFRAKSSSEWKGGNSFLREVGGASWVKLSTDTEKKIGTKLFLAFATKQAGQILMKAYIRQNLEK